MRITQNIIQSAALSGFQQNLRQISDAQQRVSTGLRILKPSDDPAGTNGAMLARSSLRALDQYRRNIDMTRARTDSEETALSQLSDLLIRAKELAITQGSDTANAVSRRTAQAEVKQLLHFARELANTQVAGSYIFGGNRADQPPVAWPDPDAAAPEITLDPLDPGEHRTEISPGQFIQTTNNANDVFAAGGIFAALWDLSEALGANDADAVRNSISGLETGFNHVQSTIGDVGARATRLQVTAANLDALEINLLTFKSDLEEVDFEKAVTELVGRQTAFQAAMLATSRVMGMTLTDYLR